MTCVKPRNFLPLASSATSLAPTSSSKEIESVVSLAPESIFMTQSTKVNNSSSPLLKLKEERVLELNDLRSTYRSQCYQP